MKNRERRAIAAFTVPPKPEASEGREREKIEREGGAEIEKERMSYVRRRPLSIRNVKKICSLTWTVTASLVSSKPGKINQEEKERAGGDERETECVIFVKGFCQFET